MRTSNKATETKSNTRRVKSIYKILTGLLLFMIVSGIAYFIYTPLRPKIVEAKIKLKKIAPYNIGYRSSVNVFSRLSPITTDNYLVSDKQKKTLEYVDHEKAEIADLEEKNTELEIKSAEIYGDVVDGLDQNSMSRGFWHFPESKAPGERGNVVVIGHRFDKLPPDPETFYHLDKVTVGDKITIYQKNHEYVYTVTQTAIIAKDDISVIQNTSDYRLTLITCTPLWTAEKRLVVIAVQDEVTSVT